MAKRARKKNRLPANFKPVPWKTLSPEVRLAVSVGQSVMDYIFEKLPKGAAVPGDQRDLKELTKELRSKIQKGIREQLQSPRKPPRWRRG